MAEGERSIAYYVAASGRRPFAEWLLALKDRNAAARIQVKIDRLRMTSFRDFKSLGRGLMELRIDAGPGFRVYFSLESSGLVLILLAGDKSTQRRDIDRARVFLADFHGRTDA